jgi:type II restriction enzyme
MNLFLNLDLAVGYNSATQKARRITEGWVAENMFCPRCGNFRIEQFENNRPVSDFFCCECKNIFELKSKNGKLGDKVNDGAYRTMIERITSNTNPDFLFMGYNSSNHKVDNLVVVPRHFFIPALIEKRKPLSQTARRAGWTGCNIILTSIPEQGRIFIVKDGKVESPKMVVETLNRSRALETTDINARGWLFDVLSCVNMINDASFSLSQIYEFEESLSKKHPENHNVKAKIRQQLQLLRDKRYLEFNGNGVYKKL